MVRVLMVCLGNICRSPLAEGILKSKVFSNNVFVDSAGTAAYHVGNLPDSRSIDVAKKYGIDITNQRARAFTAVDFESFDYIYVMDISNYNHIINLANTSSDKEKVKLILNGGLEVPDPYYGGEGGFENVYELLEKSCTLIAEKITK